MINKGRSPNLGHVTKTRRVDLDLLFERVNLDRSILTRHVRTNDPLADMLTKGVFTTQHWHSLLSLRQFIRPCESSDVRSFSRKPLSCSALAKPQAMSQMMTQAECFDQMLDQHSSKVLKSGCIFVWSRDLGAVEHSMSLHVHKTRTTFLQECSSPCMRVAFAGRGLISDLGRQKSLWDNWSSRQWPVENARGGSSRLLRFCSMYENVGHELARNQIQHEVEWASRAIQGIRKENWWGSNSFDSDSTHLLAAKRTRWCSKSMNSLVKAKENMDNVLLQKLPSSNYLHGNDERNSDFFKGTERR